MADSGGHGGGAREGIGMERVGLTGTVLYSRSSRVPVLARVHGLDTRAVLSLAGRQRLNRAKVDGGGRRRWNLARLDGRSRTGPSPIFSVAPPSGVGPCLARPYFPTFWQKGANRWRSFGNSMATPHSGPRSSTYRLRSSDRASSPAGHGHGNRRGDRRLQNAVWPGPISLGSHWFSELHSVVPGLLCKEEIDL